MKHRYSFWALCAVLASGALVVAADEPPAKPSGGSGQAKPFRTNLNTGEPATEYDKVMTGTVIRMFPHAIIIKRDETGQYRGQDLIGKTPVYMDGEKVPLQRVEPGMRVRLVKGKDGNIKEITVLQKDREGVRLKSGPIVVVRGVVKKVEPREARGPTVTVERRGGGKIAYTLPNDVEVFMDDGTRGALKDIVPGMHVELLTGVRGEKPGVILAAAPEGGSEEAENGHRGREHEREAPGTEGRQVGRGQYGHRDDGFVDDDWFFDYYDLEPVYASRLAEKIKERRKEKERGVVPREAPVTVPRSKKQETFESYPDPYGIDYNYGGHFGGTYAYGSDIGYDYSMAADSAYTRPYYQQTRHNVPGRKSDRGFDLYPDYYWYYYLYNDGGMDHYYGPYKQR